MENIFKNSNNPFDINEGKKSSNDSSVNIANQYNNLKEDYHDIFIEAAMQIRNAIDKFKPENPCNLCSIKCDLQKKDIFSDYPVGCKYKEWQSETLSFLAGEYRQKLKLVYDLIMKAKENYTCNKCGDCCRLAVSPYSYEQLKQKAYRGDKFSEDFVSVYVPYKSEEEARAANPEYFDALGDLVDSKTYYYYCTKLKDNLCSDYENRPNICKDFPHNPLKLLPSKCSYVAWRQEIEKQALLLNAKKDIINFYKQKLS